MEGTFLDWAVDLSNICKKIYLVHRRDDFRAAQHTVNQMNEISKSGKIEVLTSFQPKELIGEKLIEKIRITNSNTNEDKLLKVDSVLAFFGLKMELGPIAEWGLNLDKNIKVNAENFETNEKGIFAIGDICLYPGKLKLILVAFMKQHYVLKVALIGLDQTKNMYLDLQLLRARYRKD